MRLSLLTLATSTLGVAVALVGCGSDDTEPGATTAAATETAASSSTGGGETGDPDTGVDSDADADADTAGTTQGSDPDSSGGETGDCTTDPSACPASPGAISVELADALLSAGSAVALDVRGADAFATEHLPGAGVLDAGDLRATVDGVDGQVAPPNTAQLVFEAAGIEPTDALVVYGGGNDTATARVVWTLAYYGHTGDVWMLDGGLPQWTAQGYGVETGAFRGPGSVFSPVTVPELRVDAAWVLDHLDDATVTLVDARSDGEYDAGHIPGAVSVDWVLNLDEDGLLRPAGELSALYGDPADDQTLVVYCQTGSRASVDWLVLTMLGYDDVRIYDGSWSEWSADPNNPQE